MKNLIVCGAVALVCFGSSCGGGAQTQPLPANEIALTPVGTATGDAVQTMVPTTGGTLVSADGRLTLEVPPGALQASRLLSIAPITNQAPGGVGVAYRLGPDGTAFSAPVKLTFKYGDADIAGSEALALKVATQNADGSWGALKSDTRDDAAKTIGAETSHFSDWSLVAGFQLRPPTALLRAGATVELAVYACTNRVDGTDELAELRYKCRPDPDFFTVQAWAANGVVNGNASVGTFTAATDTSATFRAPAVAPAMNPVVVSASTTDVTTKRKTILTANIYVEEHPRFSGMITSTQKDDGTAPGLVITTEATVTFVWNEAMALYLVDSTSSTVTAHWDIVQPPCETHLVSPATPIGSMDGIIIITELGYFATGATTLDLAGTASCNAALPPEPMSLTTQVEWWPVAPGSILPIQPDGSLDDRIDNQLTDGGRTVSARWTLTPKPAP